MVGRASRGGDPALEFRGRAGTGRAAGLDDRPIHARRIAKIIRIDDELLHRRRHGPLGGSAKGSLSAYTRKLFRDDYIREMARLVLSGAGYEVAVAPSGLDENRLEQALGADLARLESLRVEVQVRGITVENVGIRSKGRTSRRAAKPELRVDVNRDAANQLGLHIGVEFADPATRASDQGPLAGQGRRFGHATRLDEAETGLMPLASCRRRWQAWKKQPLRLHHDANRIRSAAARGRGAGA